MNVYDFDGTIYKGDSSVNFYIFSFLRFPWILLLLPYQILGILAYKCKICSKETEKSVFFSFVALIPNVGRTVDSFWRKHIKLISPWYLQQKKEEDVIISASPEFLLEAACEIMGVRHLIASKVDKATGRFLGRNCYGGEKVKRFRALFPEVQVSAFYSDSRTDAPMASISHEAYYVTRYNIVEKW